jgi:hypothetical protein
MSSNLIERVFSAFAEDLRTVPPMSLRGGNAVDDYREATPFDVSLDAVTDEYLEKYFFGVAHLDPASWRHYLPHLIDLALRTLDRPGNATDALLMSLRPPDREPPRLSSLSAEQERVVVDFLEVMAFDPRSMSQAFACQVMEEWWIPGALYRPATEG